MVKGWQLADRYSIQLLRCLSKLGDGLSFVFEGIKGLIGNCMGKDVDMKLLAQTFKNMVRGGGTGGITGRTTRAQQSSRPLTRLAHELANPRIRTTRCAPPPLTHSPPPSHAQGPEAKFAIGMAKTPSENPDLSVDLVNPVGLPPFGFN